MRCENCQKDVQNGSYLSYHGNQIAWVRSGNRNDPISGSSGRFLCSDCVSASARAIAMRRRAVIYRGWARFFGLVACVVGFVALININDTAEVFWLITALLAAFALSLFLTGQVEKKREVISQKLLLLY